MRQITSRGNPLIKRFTALASDKGARAREGLIAIEGARLCLDALHSGLAFRNVYVTERALQKYPDVQALLEKADEGFLISESAAKKMSHVETPQGVFAECERFYGKRPGRHKQDARYLLLCALQDSGNVGTVIRTAEAFGLDGIAMTSDCPDVYSPKVLRASMGGAFRLHIWTSGDMAHEIAQLKSEGVTVYASSLEPNASKLGGMRFEGACAVLLGNEGTGLAAGLIKACDGVITIPMAGRADSLSVAMAASIFAWEMKK